MKRVFVFIGWIFGATALASPNPDVLKAAFESLPSCQNFVRFDDDNLYLGFGPYTIGFEEPRQPIPSTFEIVPIAHPDQLVTLATTDSAIGSIRYGNSLFILTYSGIEEWDLNARKRLAKYDTYDFSGTMAYMQQAQDFALYGDHMAIIAHGRLGISFFDLNARRVVNQFPLVQSQLPLESMATGVSVVGQYAYVLMDSFSLVADGQKPPFRGIIVVDLNSQSVVTQLDGLDPGADSIVTDGQKFIVSFDGNPLWKYSLSDFSGQTLSPPEQQVWSFPVNGNPIGHASMDDQYYYTCFSKEPMPVGSNGGIYQQVPMALNRAELRLN